jgi:NAD(P)H dehydrogenase (quinone)
LPKILLIIYYSKTGTTKKMASHMARGVEKEGTKAIMKKLEDCTLNDLAEADGIAVGSPILQ